MLPPDKPPPLPCGCFPLTSSSHQFLGMHSSSVSTTTRDFLMPGLKVYPRTSSSPQGCAWPHLQPRQSPSALRESRGTAALSSSLNPWDQQTLSLPHRVHSQGTLGVPLEATSTARRHHSAKACQVTLPTPLVWSQRPSPAPGKRAGAGRHQGQGRASSPTVAAQSQPAVTQGQL